MKFSQRSKQGQGQLCSAPFHKVNSVNIVSLLPLCSFQLSFRIYECIDTCFAHLFSEVGAAKAQDILHNVQDVFLFAMPSHMSSVLQKYASQRQVVLLLLTNLSNTN